ncbi:MAG TPA: YhcH/YjgK/YiaL family protein [Anaerolineaceae bacterium]|nr:YhcH/YjgK/YiaL family protein [Anaerolineaceae bacterium]HPN50225.1 YhcH/YjgK/YiaL family protein [Anaerolineaceae bacterium]
MIFESLEQIQRYKGLSAGLDRALDFLSIEDLAALPAGRLDMDGDNLYALVQEFSTRPLEQGKWEAHRRYIDVQCVAAGRERMGFAHLRDLSVGEYVAEKDFVPAAGKGNFVDVYAGAFVVFFPEDAHMPCLAVDEPEPVKKVVIKIKIQPG